MGQVMPELVRIGGSGRGVGWALSGGTLKGIDRVALSGRTLKGSDWALAVGNSNDVGGNAEFDART